jgi:uncharacterized membrane protein YkvA (DUF1232 family)
MGDVTVFHWLALTVALYATLVLCLVVAGRRETARAVARVMPECARLVRRLLMDPAVPRRHKLLLGALVVYLASPIDIVPDFIPVAGQLDDAIVVALVLRVVVGGWGPLRLLLWPERRTTSPDLRNPAAPTSSASTS